jgi:hypothetical protein
MVNQLPPTTRAARLLIGLERGDDFPRYRVAISTARGQSVWEGASVRPQGRNILLTIPARLLHVGQ